MNGEFIKKLISKKTVKKASSFNTRRIEKASRTVLVEYTYHSNVVEGNTLTLQETAIVLEGITIDRIFR